MPGKHQVSVSLRVFLTSVRESSELLQAVDKIRQDAPRGRVVLPRTRFQLVAELAYLQLYLSWEEFLEESFVRYFCGSRSPNGTTYPRLIKPKDNDSARAFLFANRRYLDWTDHSAIVRIAETVFQNGGPFATLSSSSRTLTDMKKIRNRITHRSQSARNEFEDVVRQQLGSMPRPVLNAGAFLVTEKPATTSGVQRESFFEYYSRSIGVLATLVAP